MNFKGIILVIASLFFIVSCSVENDSVMNDVNAEMTAGTIEYASLIFNVGLGTSTKSVTANGTEEGTGAETSISNCIMIITKGNATSSKITAITNVTGSNLVYNSDNTWSINANMVVKATNDLYVTVITNVDYSTFASCSTLGEVQTKKVGLNTESLVKCSSAVAIGEIPSQYKSAHTTDLIPYTIPTISLTQLAAKVELVAFNVAYTGETGTNMEEPAVSLESTNLVNAKTTSCLYMQDSDATLATLADQNLDSSAKFSCYTFQNNDAGNKTSLQLTVKVGNIMKTKTYTVKTPNGTSYDEIVKAGYVYRVTVNLIVNRISKEFDVTLHYEAVPFDQVTVNVPNFD